MSVISLSKEREVEFKARINEASIPVVLTFLNETGSAHDITSYDFELIVSSQPNSGTVFTLSIGDGLTVAGVGNNQLQIEVSKVRATQRPKFYFAKLFSVAEDHTWLSAPWEFYEQPYDSEVNDETITINPNGTPIAVTMSSPIDQYLSFNRQIDDYTLALTDNFNAVEMDKATANTVTVPPNSSVAFPIGSQVNILQYGAGQTTIAAGSGVTLRYSVGLNLVAQYDGCTLTKVATDEWYLNGALEA